MPKGIPLWQEAFWAWMEVKQRIFNMHPNLGQEITRQPLYLNANICNEQNKMWGEEVNNKL
jgi:hypothetical protein